MQESNNSRIKSPYNQAKNLPPHSNRLNLMSCWSAEVEGMCWPHDHLVQRSASLVQAAPILLTITSCKVRLDESCEITVTHLWRFFFLRATAAQNMQQCNILMGSSCYRTTPIPLAVSPTRTLNSVPKRRTLPHLCILAPNNIRPMIHIKHGTEKM